MLMHATRACTYSVCMEAQNGYCGINFAIYHEILYELTISDSQISRIIMKKINVLKDIWNRVLQYFILNVCLFFLNSKYSMNFFQN